MLLLLDTQVMLWWLLDDPRLGTKTRALLAASPCLGKLDVTPAAFRDQSLAAGVALLPVLDAHVIGF